MPSPASVRGDALLSPVDASKPPLAVLFGLSGYTLTADETAFFKDADPLGFILFTRNAREPQELKALTQSLKDCIGRDVPILIDQEGGRVARLKPPHWAVHPAAGTEGEVAGYNSALALRNVEAINRSIATMLRDAGVNVNCTPVLDVLFPETHGAIGNRAFSSDPGIVGALGAAVCRAHLAEGIVPVVKHMPGQGRADMDSHVDLPVVAAALGELEKVDFAPYRHILQQEFARAVWGMVAHVVYKEIDPVHPATCSPDVMKVIRGEMGFGGFLLSDDIVMNALGRYMKDTLGLQDDMGQRAVRTLKAGCDAALHCNGVMNEMKMVAAAAPKMSAEAVLRFNASIAPMVA